MGGRSELRGGFSFVVYRCFIVYFITINISYFHAAMKTHFMKSFIFHSRNLCGEAMHNTTPWVMTCQRDGSPCPCCAASMVHLIDAG